MASTILARANRMMKDNLQRHIQKRMDEYKMKEMKRMRLRRRAPNVEYRVPVLDEKAGKRKEKQKNRAAHEGEELECVLEEDAVHAKVAWGMR